MLAWPVQRDGDGCQIQLERGSLRFVTSRGATDVGITGIDLALQDPKAALDRAIKLGIEHSAGTIAIGGAKFRLSAA